MSRRVSERKAKLKCNLLDNHYRLTKTCNREDITRQSIGTKLKCYYGLENVNPTENARLSNFKRKIETTFVSCKLCRYTLYPFIVNTSAPTFALHGMLSMPQNLRKASVPRNQNIQHSVPLTPLYSTIFISKLYPSNSSLPCPLRDKGESSPPQHFNFEKKIN